MKIIVNSIFFVLILFFALWYFSSVTRLSRMGDQIVQLKHDLSQLERENRDLYIALSKHSYAARIEEQAKRGGMVFDAKFVYIKTPSSLAVSKR